MLNISINDINKLKASCALALLLFTGSPMKTEAYAEDTDVSFNITTIGEPMYYDSLYAMLDNLPEGIKQYLIDNELKVVVMEDANGAEKQYERANGYTYGGIAGFLWPKLRTIYVESTDDVSYFKKYPEISEGYEEDEFNYIVSSDTLIHELGHFFDYTMDFELSHSIEFCDIYYAEAEDFTNTTEYKVDNLDVFANISIPEEYFATAYACYVKYPQELAEICPRTYEYIDRFMQKINEEYCPQISEEYLPQEEPVLTRRHTR